MQMSEQSAIYKARVLAALAIELTPSLCTSKALFVLPHEVIMSEIFILIKTQHGI